MYINDYTSLGVGDHIGIFDNNGDYKRVYKTNICAIARIYRYMTLLLGIDTFVVVNGDSLYLLIEE